MNLGKWKKIYEDGGSLELRVSRDTIDATPMSEPDPDWRYTDKSGHTHRWRFKPFGLPTLKWIIDIPATEEYPEYGHYECRQCGETVKPEERPVTERRYVAGLSEYFINDESVTPQTFRAVDRMLRKKLE